MIQLDVNNQFLKRLTTVATLLLSFAVLAAPLTPQLTVIEDGFSAAVGIRHANDGSERLFVIEQTGRIIIVKNGQQLATPFLDISSLTSGSGEQGLLGLAFHPDYSNNGFFYIDYTNNNGDTIIRRYTVDSQNADVADTSTALKIISIDQDFGNHNGGDIHFSPNDGYLYIGMGDGGKGNDPCNRAQTTDPDDISEEVVPNPGGYNCQVDTAFTNQGGNADSRALLGAMLRIDVDNPGNNVSDACGEGVNYGIPNDNPFSDSNNDCGEIWASGLRNPYRWGFDRLNGDLFIGDVGQGTREEVDYQSGTSNGGENYGWVCREGFIANPSVTCSVPNAVDPIVDYDSTMSRCSVIGGFPYRGPESTWTGTYIYADFCTGELFWSERQGGVWSDLEVLLDTPGNIRGFGEDQAGNLYFTSGDEVIQITDQDFIDLIFKDGFDN